MGRILAFENYLALEEYTSNNNSSYGKVRVINALGYRDKADIYFLLKHDMNNIL